MTSKYYTSEQFIDYCEAYFLKHGTASQQLLGMEFEHLLIDAETLRSYDYYEAHGQRDLLEALVKKDWRILFEEDGHVLGIEWEGHTLTLEPGGQVEISLKPFATVTEIDAAYNRVLERIEAELYPDQCLVSIGYHPKSSIADLSLLPKKRYQMMYDYFTDNGRFCHHMMKGTAATQVSIDYRDEMDFIKKFRVANYLSPAIASLFDATPVFEGSLEAAGNRRLRIWQETDIKRSKLIPGSLSKTFGFSEYGQYLLDIPPILLQLGGVTHHTKQLKLVDLLSHYAFEEGDIEHLFSMVFPDVRLKKFIEIRMPDALPYPYNLAVASLVKGIFYNKENLDAFYLSSLQVDDQWVIDQNQKLLQSQLHDRHPSLEALKEQMVAAALKVLSEEEGLPLKLLADLVQQHGSMTAYLIDLYQYDRKRFVAEIKVAGAAIASERI